MAKLIFSGMSPVALANFNAFSFAATIPTSSAAGSHKAAVLSASPAQEGAIRWRLIVFADHDPSRAETVQIT
jgi:hypothetical protein